MIGSTDVADEGVDDEGVEDNSSNDDGFFDHDMLILIFFYLFI